MNIFVGCSSKETNEPTYLQVAEEIADFIVNGNHTLVFGGCKHGLMGVIYSKVSKSSNDIVTVVPKAFENDLQDIKCTKIYLCNTVNERKDHILTISDILVFIPGGIGTMDEIITAIETKRSYEHTHPILIVNTNMYFNPLLDMLHKTYTEGFSNQNHHNLFIMQQTELHMP